MISARASSENRITIFDDTRLIPDTLMGKRAVYARI
jgi:hypothetical protein